MMPVRLFRAAVMKAGRDSFEASSLTPANPGLAGQGSRP